MSDYKSTCAKCGQNAAHDEQLFGETLPCPGCGLEMTFSKAKARLVLAHSDQCVFCGRPGATPDLGVAILNPKTDEARNLAKEGATTGGGDFRSHTDKDGNTMYYMALRIPKCRKCENAENAIGVMGFVGGVLAGLLFLGLFGPNFLRLLGESSMDQQYPGGLPRPIGLIGGAIMGAVVAIGLGFGLLYIILEPLVMKPRRKGRTESRCLRECAALAPLLEKDWRV
jgi:predicted RNA-binding Zn-ribbon protein involved in translation (DUF1610 family)